MDQAAGLREWLAAAGGEQSEPASKAVSSLAIQTVQAVAPIIEHTLMVVGAPGSSITQIARVQDWLEQWRQQGSGWVGRLDAWKIVPVAADSAGLSALAVREQRWGLWVDDGPAAFRKGFSLLAALAENGGPGRLLALHAPGMKRQGLLQNLQQAAEVYFGIELLVLAR